MTPRWSKKCAGQGGRGTECDPAVEQEVRRARRKGSGAADRSGSAFEGDGNLSDGLW